MDADAALALFDAQLRRLDGRPAGLVYRNASPAGNWIVHTDLTAENADQVIAEQQEYFAGPTETLLVAEVGELLAGPLAGARLPDGVELVPVREPAGFAAIVGLQGAVWGGEWRSMGTGLADEYAADPSAISLFRAVAGEETVCAAWIRFHAGTDFASLWGGTTLPQWRRRGIYRALVAHRARLAADRGFRYLQVDATDDSRPILEKLGFVPLTTTTPYVWEPSTR